MEGKRPLMAEVQALVAKRGSESAPPRRVVSDLDAGRVAVILAVLQEHCGMRLYDRDVFVATVGGMRLREPSSDLAVALAIASAYRGEAVRSGLVAVGEVGLGGEIRRVVGLDRRLAEAARLGISRALVPPGEVRSPPGLVAVAVDDLREALGRVGLERSQV
jgi:DNA repair protein RadA/Sms